MNVDHEKNTNIDRLSLLLEDDVNAFAKEFHIGLENNSYTLKELEVFIEKIHEDFLLYCNDDDTYLYKDNYFTILTIIEKVKMYIFAELERQIRKRTINLDGTTLHKNGETWDIDNFQKKLQKQAEKFGDENYFEFELKRLLSGQAVGNELQLSLLENFNANYAALIMDMICLVGNFSSIETLQDIQRVNIEEYTKDELKELHARSIHSLYCYSFLEQASSSEIYYMQKEMDKLKEAISAKEIVLQATIIDFDLGKGIPLFPHTTYKLLTDEKYTVDFLVDRPDDTSIWCDEDSTNPEFTRTLELAKQGDANAQNEISCFYLAGTNVEKNDTKALYWIEKAAYQGVAQAQVNYGVAFQNGLGGLKVDYIKAIYWFLEAAKQNEDTAQLNLGLAYSAGKGVERDINKANKWFNLAANSGNAMAKLILENGLIING